MEVQTNSPKYSQFPTIPDEAIKPILVADRKIVLFELRTAYRFESGILTDLDHIWMRESDVVADSPSSAITRFLHHSHSWPDVPEGVRLNGRVVKPIPFMEAVQFWAHQAQTPGDQWAALVVRELERLEELVFNVFHGIEVPEDQQWTLAYRAFDGRPATLANDSNSLGPSMYQPSAMEREGHQRNQAAVA